jgi:putative oxidoreductase
MGMAFTTRTSLLADTALLGLRGVVGGYVAAHGAQKLFGSFGGHGLEGTGQFFEEGLDLAPGKEMAAMAGGSELVGGTLTAAGLGGPLGPMAIIGAMAVASQTAHRGKGPFTSDGGPELPLTNLAAAATLAVVGPGHLSLDTLLRMKPSKVIVALAAMAGVGAAAAVIQTQAARRARPTPVTATSSTDESMDVELPLSA